MILFIIVASVGLTMIMIRGSIFEKLREWSFNYTPILSCGHCTGFWAGLFLGVAYDFWNAPLYGFVSSLFSYLIDQIMLKYDI